MLALHHTFSNLLLLRFRRVYISELILTILSDRPDRCICNHLLYLGPTTSPLRKMCVEYYQQPLTFVQKKSGLRHWERNS